MAPRSDPIADSASGVARVSGTRSCFSRRTPTASPPLSPRLCRVTTSGWRAKPGSVPVRGRKSATPLAAATAGPAGDVARVANSRSHASATSWSHTGCATAPLYSNGDG